MSITNKKIDALRRLLLGNLYQECKDNPMGVSRERLEQHLEKIKSEGCIGDCSVEEFVKTCQLKTHYPTCVSGEYRGCIEDIGERSKGVDKFYYDQYKKGKTIEDEPDTDEEEEEEGEVCNVCGLSGDDEIGLPVQEMSCGHHSHVNCLIKIAQQKGRDNAQCPECRREYTLEEVPVPVRTIEQRQADSIRRAQFNASQMGFNIQPEEEETEEDRMSDIIVQNIYQNRIDDAINKIREFNQFSLRSSLFSLYISSWLISILKCIFEEENSIEISTDDINRLLEVIYESRTRINLRRRTIETFNRKLRGATREQVNKIFFIINSLSKYYVRTEHEDSLGYFCELLISSNLGLFLNKLFKVADEENKSDNLKEAILNAINELDLDNIEEDTKELIIFWFSRHRYEPPSFERENIAEQLTESIVNNIREHNIMYVEETVAEFYEREFSEDISEYQDVWIDKLLDEIHIGQMNEDSVKRIVDAFAGSSIPLSGSLRRINRFLSSDSETKKEHTKYILKTLMESNISFDSEMIVKHDINIAVMSSLYEVLREILSIESNNDLFKEAIEEIIEIEYVEDETVINMLRAWFRRHGYQYPQENNPSRRLNFDDDEDDDRPLQISSLTPPHERVHRGRWFGKFRR